MFLCFQCVHIRFEDIECLHQNLGVDDDKCWELNAGSRYDAKLQAAMLVYSILETFVLIRYSCKGITWAARRVW